MRVIFDINRRWKFMQEKGLHIVMYKFNQTNNQRFHCIIYQKRKAVPVQINKTNNQYIQMVYFCSLE